VTDGVCFGDDDDDDDDDGDTGNNDGEQRGQCRWTILNHRKDFYAEGTR
jgi:hypothetical protein